jgi:hypothetical protein
MHYLSMRLTPSTTWNLSLMLGSNCFTGEQTDDGVLQIIKALLTAVTSPTCDIHAETLLTVSSFAIF